MSETASNHASPPSQQRWLKRFLVTVGLLAAASAIGIAITLWPQTVTNYTDADTIKESQSTAVIRDILWQPPKPLADLLEEAGDIYEPRLSLDGQSLYFVRGKAGENADIYVATKTKDGWTSPKPLSDINTDEDELGPEPSADGQSLYFYSNRIGGFGGYDLWLSHRIVTDGQITFSEPVNLGPATNSPYNDYGPAVSPDGKTLYFASNRPLPADTNQPNPNAWPGTLREDLYHRTYDLYHAPLTDAGIGNALPLGVLNTPFNEGTPAVSTVGDFLYFSSDRPDSEGGFDLYRARRLLGEHKNIESLGQAVNSPANELDPALAMGGFELYFSSDRPREPLTQDKPNPYNLYRTASREVFRNVDTFQPSFNWAALWSAIGPNLLWALLALLLMLLLATLMRDMHSRKLSLLARCLMVSLFAHFLLMLLFNVWEVGSTLAKEFGRKGPIQVAIASPTIGQAIASQVRGEFATTEPPPTPQLTMEYQASPLNFTPSTELAAIRVDRGQVKDAQIIVDKTPLRDAEPTPSVTKPTVTQMQLADALTQPLDFTIPDEVRRENVSENRSLTLPTSRSIAKLDRPTIDKSVSDTASNTTTVELPPQPLDPQQLKIQTPTAASKIMPRASQPVEQFQLQQSESSAVLQLASLPLDITIPTAMETQQTSSSETNDIDNPIAPLTHARSDFLAASQTKIRPAELTAITPTATKLETDSKPAALPLPIAHDNAPARTDVVSLPSAATQYLPSLPLTDFTLPNVEESSGAKNADESLAYANQQQLSNTRAALNLTQQSGNPTTVQINPAQTDEDSLFKPLNSMPIATTEIREALAIENSLASITPRSYTKPMIDFPLLDLRLPTETQPEVKNENYTQRSEDKRQSILEERGGTNETEAAVARALKWLAAHQSEDGHWDGDSYDGDCHECDGQTDALVDVAITSLSLLTFLAADHTHTKPGPYQRTVDKALQWLLKQQHSNGDLRSDETMYTHGMATIALSEAFGMTGDSRLEPYVRKAIRFIDRARNKRDGGWRYDPGQPGDTSVLGWQVMALHSAQMAGIEIPMRNITAARKWMKKVSIPSKPGLYRYQPRAPVTRAMTAEGMFIQQLLGHQANESIMQASARHISQFPPDWNKEPNTYFWYYGTLALYQHGGPQWDQWNSALTKTLLANQRRDGRAAGSWNPVGEWAQTGGRVCQTALCTLMLEVYYRYLPLYANPQPIDAIGSIQGIVTDVSTGKPLAGVTITLDVVDRSQLTTTTDAEGEYTLAIPEMPEFFAMSASREAFIPASANMSSARIARGVVRQDFDLQPQRYDVVTIEPVPQVHHLGDDNFDGKINSQFQKKAEGDSFHIEFTISSAHQLERAKSATIRLLAKGVQEDHRLVFNDIELAYTLDDAPRDGSFGEFSTELDPTILHVGVNTFDIFAGRRGNDVDDFEFVNVQIHFELAEAN